MDALREHVSAALAVPVDDITLSRNQALVRSASSACAELFLTSPAVSFLHLEGILQPVSAAVLVELAGAWCRRARRTCVPRCTPHS